MPVLLRCSTKLFSGFRLSISITCLIAVIPLACAEPKPKPDTREKAERAHEELEHEESQQKERKKSEEGTRDESRRDTPPAGGAVPGGHTVPGAPGKAAEGVETASIAPMATERPKPTSGDLCLWREAEGVVDFGEHDTPYQAKGRATALARKNAVRDALGYEIRARDAIFQQESLAGQQTLVESIITSTQSGLILNETLLNAEIVPGSGGSANKYRVRLKTCVAQLPDKMDKGFRVSLDLNRQNFVNGDDAVATISVTREACVYLLNVDAEGNWSRVFPNEYATENCTSPTRPIEYPNAQILKMGVHMKAELPHGQRTSTEALRAIAFRTKMDHVFSAAGAVHHPRDDEETYGETYNDATGKLGELFRRIIAEDVEWAEDSAAYVIHAK